jgi:hypothetical protein
MRTARNPIASNPIASNPIASNPIASNPIASNPIASNPSTGNPSTGNPSISNAVLPHHARPASGYRRNGACWYKRTGRTDISERGRRVIAKRDAITLALWAHIPGQAAQRGGGRGCRSEICLTIYNDTYIPIPLFSWGYGPLRAYPRVGFGAPTPCEPTPFFPRGLTPLRVVGHTQVIKPLRVPWPSFAGQTAP